MLCISGYAFLAFFFNFYNILILLLFTFSLFPAHLNLKIKKCLKNMCIIDHIFDMDHTLWDLDVLKSICGQGIKSRTRRTPGGRYFSANKH